MEDRARDSLTSLVVGWGHGGEPAVSVRDLKYRRRTGEVTLLADRMAALAPEVDVVTWCPAHPQRRRQRRFDQAELLARAVAFRIGRPCRRLLRRTGGLAQSGQDRVGRRRGPQLVGVGPRLRDQRTVLLVDDVMTTGATLAVAAAVLVQRGAGAVHAVVATAADGRAGTRWAGTA